LRDWRRGVAGAAFLLALLFLTTRTCRNQSASAEVRFRVGAAGAGLRQLSAELYHPRGQSDSDELLGFYRREFERGSGAEAGRWSVHADPGLYRMRIVLRSSAGTARLERGLDIQDGAVITIDLESDLESAGQADRGAPPGR